MSLVKLESEAEESVWQRFCSDVDILQEDTRQVDDDTRQGQSLGEESEPEVSRRDIYSKLVVGIMRIARSIKYIKVGDRDRKGTK